MAEATQPIRPLDILGAVGQIEGIKAQRASTDLAQQRFQLSQQQLELENQRRAEQDAIAERDKRFKRLDVELDTLEERLVDPKTTPELAGRIIDRMNTITSEVSPGSMNVDKTKALADISKFRGHIVSFRRNKEHLGETNPIVQDDFAFISDLYAEDEKRAAVIARLGKDVEAERLFKRTLERKEEAFPGELERAKQKAEAEAEVRRDVAEKGRDVAIEEAEIERDRRITAIEDSNLDPKVKQSLITEIEAGVRLPDVAQRKRKETIETLGIIGRQLNQQNEDLEFVIQGAPRARLQKKFNELLGSVVGEDVLSRPTAVPAAGAQPTAPAVTVDPIKKKKNIKGFLKPFKISEIKDANEMLQEFDRLNPGVLDRDLEESEVAAILNGIKGAVENKQKGTRTQREVKVFMESQRRAAITEKVGRRGESRFKKLLDVVDAQREAEKFSKLKKFIVKKGEKVLTKQDKREIESAIGEIIQSLSPKDMLDIRDAIEEIRRDLK